MGDGHLTDPTTVPIKNTVVLSRQGLQESFCFLLMNYGACGSQRAASTPLLSPLAVFAWAHAERAMAGVWRSEDNLGRWSFLAPCDL